MKTQAQKLATVLMHGSLMMISLQALKDEIKPEDQHLHSNDERLLEIMQHDLLGQVCYEWKAYKPDEHDFITVRQFTKNPFTLIDMIYTELGL